MSTPIPSPSADYLKVLGQRVRQYRALRGMSRRILGEAAQVSERYLAQLEAGKGNASILVLRAIAEAMSVALDDLVETRAEHSPDYLLARERLRQADSNELRLIAHASTDVEPGAGRIQRIALIGLRGAGKSTLGQALAKLSGLPFVELGQEIEREAGMAISEIFSLGGQGTYRRHERDALKHVLARFERAVIATGGSIVSEPETYATLLNNCYTVWLKASPQEHMARVIAQGDHRPMANHGDAMADLRRILKERHKLYQRADCVIDTSNKSIHEVVEELGALLGTTASALA